MEFVKKKNKTKTSEFQGPVNCVYSFLLPPHPLGLRLMAPQDILEPAKLDLPSAGTLGPSCSNVLPSILVASM